MFTRMMLKRIRSLDIACKRFVHALNGDPVKFTASKKLIRFCQKTFQIPEFKVKSMMLRWPTLQSISESQITEVVSCVNGMGIANERLLDAPTMLNLHPRTLKFRYYTLQECGLDNITMLDVSRFTTILNHRTVKELKVQGIVHIDTDVWQRMVDCFHEWPEFQRSCAPAEDFKDFTPNALRLKILQKFFLYKFNISPVRFNRIVRAYSVMKNKPLKLMCQNIKLLHDRLGFDDEKISAHIFSLFIDPENIDKIVTEIKEISGVSIEEVLYRYPTILHRDFREILKIIDLLKEENIPDTAVLKCFQIFTLSSATIKERIDEIKDHPKLKELTSNPRVLSLVLNLNKVMERLSILEEVNKKCSSLHKLVSDNEEFFKYIRSFGDNSRGRDMLRAIAKILPSEVAPLKEHLTRHPYWCHIPLDSVVKNIEFLKQSFSSDEILHNCELILYPLDDITSDLKRIKTLTQNKQNKESFKAFPEISTNSDQINFNILTNMQILSILQYLLEKRHNFSGDGVWPRDHS